MNLTVSNSRVGAAGAALELVLPLVLGLLVAGCNKPAPAAAPATRPVVAEVGQRAILAEDLVAEAQHRANSRRPVPAREELLQDMVDRESLVQRARAAGLDRDPAVQREIESILIGRLLARELEPRRSALAVTDDEVKAEYEASRSKLARPAQVRMAMLFLELGAKASEARKSEARARLTEARRRFMTVAPTNGVHVVNGFGDLALQFSDDASSRHRGGDLGWIDPDRRPGRLPATVVDTARALPPGQPSEVLETEAGCYVVLKLDSRDAALPTLETAAGSLRQAVLLRKRRQLDDQFRSETARLVTSVVHTQVLSTVTLPSPPAALAGRNREPQPPGLPGTTESSHGN